MSRLIGFAGLSHLGIVYSIAAAARGFEVLAIDERPGACGRLDPRAVSRSPNRGWKNAFRDHGQRIRYSADMRCSLRQCGLIFITLDVARLTNEQEQSGPHSKL